MTSGGKVRGWESFSKTISYFVVVAPPVKATRGGPYAQCECERVKGVRTYSVSVRVFVCVLCFVLWERGRVRKWVKGKGSGSNCRTYSYPFNSKPRKLNPCLSLFVGWFKLFFHTKYKYYKLIITFIIVITNQFWANLFFISLIIYIIL